MWPASRAWLRAAAVMLGVALILFGLSHALWLSLLLMLFAGFGLMQGAAVCTPPLQSARGGQARPRDELLHHGLFRAAPFGSLLAGVLAHRIGAPATQNAPVTMTVWGAPMR